MAPIHISAREGRADLVIKALDRGWDVDDKDAQRGEALLHKACAGNHTELVRVLLARRCAVNPRSKLGRVPLHDAAEFADAAIVRALLEHRADTGARDKGGNTPLHRAAFAGREEACRAILEWRAAEALAERELVPEAEFDRSTRLVKEVDAPDMVGWTPLHFAARQGSAAVVRCLLAYEADVGGVNRFKDTPLHEACRAGHAQCAYELVLAGANTAAVNSKGKTPAMLTGDSAVLAALEGVAPPEPMKEKPVVAVERTPEPLGDVPLGPRPQDDDEQAGVFGLREADKPKAEVGRSRAEFLATLGAGDDGDDLDGPAGDFDELD